MDFSDELLEKRTKKIEEEIESEIEHEQAFKPMTWKQLMSKKFPPMKWVVQDLIPAESLTVISGYPMSYKTWILLDLIEKVAHGRMLFSKFQTNKKGILFIDEESGQRMLNLRLKKIRGDRDIDDVNVHFLSLSMFNLDNTSVNLLLTFCKENKVELIIVDSLIRIHKANENDAKEMSEVFKYFRFLAGEGIGVIFTHHNRKPSGNKNANWGHEMRGSTDFLASVDCHLAIIREGGSLLIKQVKLRHESELKPFKVNILNSSEKIRFEYAGNIKSKTQTKVENLIPKIEKILSEYGDVLYQKQIKEKLKQKQVQVGDSTLRQALKVMVRQKNLFAKKGKGNTTLYSLNPCE